MRQARLSKQWLAPQKSITAASRSLFLLELFHLYDGVVHVVALVEADAAATEGHTGAEIEAVMRDGLYEAFADGADMPLAVAIWHY